jgi:hypothetical protein
MRHERKLPYLILRIFQLIRLRLGGKKAKKNNDNLQFAAREENNIIKVRFSIQYESKAVRKKLRSIPETEELGLLWKTRREPQAYCLVEL